MAKMEQIELVAKRAQLNADVKQMVGKYRSIFEWDVPDINETLSDKLILAALREALDDIEKNLPGANSGA